MKITKSQLKQIIKEEMEKVLNEEREYAAAGTAFDTEANAIKLFLGEYPQYAQTVDQVEAWRDQKETGVWYLRHPELSKTVQVRIADVKFKSNVPGGYATDPTRGGKLPAVQDVTSDNQTGAPPLE